MSILEKLIRPDILTLSGYKAASYRANSIRLNANESAYRTSGDESECGLNRYPRERPTELTRALAEHYGVAADQILVSRGSSEAIDLLIRSFCEASRDSIAVCPPAFAMYEVYARIQGAGVIRYPLEVANGFQPNATAILGEWHDSTKLLFLTSPNNPTGNAFESQRVWQLIEGLANRAVVVIDAAYTEFDSNAPDLARLLSHPHVTVLRTLSKAGALAGARVGCVMGDPQLISLLDKVMAPYSIPTPVVESAMSTLSKNGKQEQTTRIKEVIAERARVATALGRSDLVQRVFNSDANFLFVQFHDAQKFLDAASDRNLLLRDYTALPELSGCLRITVGSPCENDALLACLYELGSRE